MQTKSLLLALVLGGAMLVQTGCSTYSYTSRSTSVNQRAISSSQATADIEINFSQKVTASSDFQKFPGQAKQEAIYRCIMNGGIDVLIDPIFQVEHRSSIGYRATVTGFAGHYRAGKNGLDEVIEKQYSKEDIEKYLLLTDPNFYPYYYQQGSGKGNVYNIKCTTQESKSSSLLPIGKPGKQKAAKAKKEKKSRKAKKAAMLGME